jgi:hypothetical protein
MYVDLTATATFNKKCPESCDDGYACTKDSCDEVEGKCLHTPITCPTQSDPCLGPFTCSEPVGCQAVPVANGQPCPGGSCSSGVCIPGCPPGMHLDMNGTCVPDAGVWLLRWSGTYSGNGTYDCSCTYASGCTGFASSCSGTAFYLQTFEGCPFDVVSGLALSFSASGPGVQG